ncbi:flagellar hook assembly protein FlgD [Microvirga massiliensis]|uniref:flagellar hook assembly protein FlgD n=1 Tax=Microvirga massiliensis TaxID=1033741 RepID=UPI00062B68D1|nr:flagellar hook assembly protein FlgD [Microvirga massiliensis]
MNVNSSLPTGATASRATTGNSGQDSGTVGYDNFLKLLLAQMKNQDPTEPMKSTDYMAQLATFSQVEQSVKTNSKLDSLLSSYSLSQADTVIGRTITSADGSISGKVESVYIASDGAVANLEGGAKVVIGPGIVIS